MENKWFQSKKFWTVIVTLFVTAGNEQFGWGIDTNQSLDMILLALAYLVIQSALDYVKHYLDKKHQDPMGLPMIREAIESLSTNYYDFSRAKEIGVDAAAKEIKERVIAGLDQLLPDPLFQKVLEDEQVSFEIMRIVFKLYNHDIKMIEGAELVKSSLQS
ncbi:hypothetical protein ACTFSJ_27725 [Bacillus cereus group sp. MYBK12-2]|uniref:hypothetical protein n=1 Tax=Bacillus cereus group sp. MYBK12-2 TaxID=3450689 RepID=UPI003303B435|nr:hypothetical protein [Bacillus pacificus]HDR7653590.1 hypothetical protein [Bacillus pacificus]